MVVLEYGLLFGYFLRSYQQTLIILFFLNRRLNVYCNNREKCSVPELKVNTAGYNSRIILSQKCPTHMGPIFQLLQSYECL